MRTRCQVVVALALVAFASGCGGGSGSAPGDSGLPAGGATTGTTGSAVEDACGLVTDEEAAAAAGNAVKPGKLVGIVCIWEPVDLDDDKNLQVSVAWVPIPPGGDPAQMCQAGLPGIPDSKPLPGVGVGNSAYWDFGAGGISNTGSLHICMDQGLLDTSAIGQRPEAELQQIAVSLAQTATGRV